VSSRAGSLTAPIERYSALRYQVFQPVRCQSQSGSLCGFGFAFRVLFQFPLENVVYAPFSLR